MKSFVALALLLVSNIASASAFDCHLAREGQQDSLIVFHSCNTEEGHFNDADAVCRLECEKRGCATYYVNTYKPVKRVCGQ